MINITEFGQILTLALILPVQTHLYFLLLWDLSQTEKVAAEILIIFGLSFLLNEYYRKSKFFFFFSPRKENPKKPQQQKPDRNKPPPKIQQARQKVLLKPASQKVNLHPHSCRSKSLNHTKLWNASSIFSKATDTQTFIKPVWAIFLFLLQHVFTIHASFKSFLYAPCIWITS